MVVSNKSKYNEVDGFCAYKVPSSDSYAYMKTKQNDLFVRSYFEYKYCTSKGGVVFFYTLTFNDRNLCFPSLKSLTSCKDFSASWVFDDFDFVPIDVPCIENSRFRTFCNGMFRKDLLNKYGCTFKYVCCTEFGEGKGKRGKGFNPHLHVLFFVYPNSGCVSPTPFEFDYLVKKYWQGTYDGSTLIKNPKNFINGIAAKSNLNNGVIASSAGICYVSKYVAKDALRANKVSYIHNFYISQLAEYYANDVDTCVSFALSRGSIMVNEMSFDEKMFQNFLVDFGLVDVFKQHCNVLARELYYAHFYKFVRRLYLPKCFISNNVGASGYNCINKHTYKVVISSDKGTYNYKMPLYYYRRFMCDIVYIDGNVTFVPNNEGLKFRKYCFKKQLQNTEQRYFGYFALLKLCSPSQFFTDDSKHNKLILNGFQTLYSTDFNNYGSCAHTLSCVSNFYLYYLSADKDFITDFDKLSSLYANVLSQRVDYLHYMAESGVFKSVPQYNRYFDTNVNNPLYSLAYLFMYYEQSLRDVQDTLKIDEYNKQKITQLSFFEQKSVI